ncbi:hypothetical protein BS47DRAFT_1484105 [Hydnum rufescens UP504]|uniref:Uncharacterized protein n=1 Tax=Hydnum rufescens UP504 TaxID=1448309 RepID=A0A9P6B220_9AGAM|nr:hypothetical protein BS47DRAFT_1484105 [Hydnum rufescens UP504]
MDSGDPSNEVKRHNQADKAKLHLLRQQLQTRLQYARLKVDHGWMRQNLNEVENLYFHHYRARSPTDPVDEANMKPRTGTMPSSAGSKSSLLSLPTRSIPRAISKSPSIIGATPAATDSIGKRPGGTAYYSPYSPSPSTALALTASSNYANIHTRSLPVSARGSPAPPTQPPTPAASHINSGTLRVSSSVTSALGTNPYSMTNLSRLGPAPVSIHGNSTSRSPVMWHSQHPRGPSDGGAQTYDSFWSLLSGASLPTPGPIMVPLGTGAGISGHPDLSSRGKTPALLAKRSGVRKKTTVKNGRAGSEVD